MTKERNQQPERWERIFSKIFWVLVACAWIFVAYLYLKDWLIGLAQARQRGTLGAELLHTGIRSLPLVVVIGLSLYLRRYRSAINQMLSKRSIVSFIYNFAIFFAVTAAFGFLNRTFWSWYFLLAMPLGAAVGFTMFPGTPSESSDAASQSPR